MSKTLDLLKEFVRDVEAAYGSEPNDHGQPATPGLIRARLRRDTGWYDLGDTYERARKHLDELEANKPIQIKRWLRSGELGEPKDTEKLLEAAAAAMDSSCTWEICGDCIFEGEDGVVYVGTVEFCIGQYNPELLAELKKELEHEQDDATEG